MHLRCVKIFIMATGYTKFYQKISGRPNRILNFQLPGALRHSRTLCHKIISLEQQNLRSEVFYSKCLALRLKDILV